MIGQPQTFTAVEANRNFGRIQDEAVQAPVVITHHGRPRLAILAIDEYRRLTGDRPDEAATAEVQRRKLMLILDNVTDGYVSLGRDWRYLTVNRAAEFYLGRPREELVGRTWTEAFPQLRGSEAEAQFRRAMEDGEIVGFTWTSVVHPNRRVEIRAFPLPLSEGGIGILFRNISQRERLEARLCLAEAHLAAVLGETPDVATLSYDMDGVVIGWSAGAERLLGWSRDEMVDRPVEALFTAEDRATGAPWSEMGAARRERRVEAVATRLRRDGRPVTVRDVVVWLPEAGQSYLKMLSPVAAAGATGSGRDAMAPDRAGAPQ